jgi:chemotaxis protein methyltransferase WspC
MSFAPFEAMLRDVIGLDAESIGRGAVARAVLERQGRCGIGDLQAYWEHVSASPAERQQLINTVIVPETWFFRDREAFTALRSLVLERLVARPDAPVRILSLPCASGEEAYSMAMLLLETGVAPDRFQIDGVDVSDRQVERARLGLYGSRSFRGQDLAFRDRYFQPQAARYRVNDDVRQQVEFHHRSLFAADIGLQPQSYDVIWCRNLLIYFDRKTQDAALRILARLLAHDGLLFVGSSETGAIPADEFESIRLPMAFAFRKRGDARLGVTFDQARLKPGAASDQARLKPGATTGGRAPFPFAAPSASKAAASPVVTVAPPADAATDLRRVQELADSGRFAEAAPACEAHLRRYGPSADGLYLHALVLDASGRLPEAEQSYRKALYLNPRHHDALMHLGLLLDRQARAADARVVRQRLQRLAQDGEA